MNKFLHNLAFRFMALGFTFRDIFQPRKNILQEVGIKAGFKLLDYGCGPGSYIPAASEMVGETGKIYALDAEPLAVKTVQGMISKKQITNVETILTDCRTGLPDSSLDVVLLYDVLHGLDNPELVLREIHRTLKPAGILSLNDHHLKEDEIVSRVTGTGLFTLSGRGEYTCTFAR